MLNTSCSPDVRGNFELSPALGVSLYADSPKKCINLTAVKNGAQECQALPPHLNHKEMVASDGKQTDENGKGDLH